METLIIIATMVVSSFMTDSTELNSTSTLKSIQEMASGTAQNMQ